MAAGTRPRGRTRAAWDSRELARRCRDGSVAAYAEFVRQYSGRLLNLAVRLTGSRDTAETAVCETFLAAFRSMERTSPPPATWPWLAALVVRRIGGRETPGGRVAPGSHRPSSVPGVRRHIARPDPTPASTWLVVPQADRWGEVDAALLGLPYEVRAALALRWVAGLDPDEAAKAMGVSRAACRGFLKDGLGSLRGFGSAPGGDESAIDRAGAACAEP